MSCSLASSGVRLSGQMRALAAGPTASLNARACCPSEWLFLYSLLQRPHVLMSPPSVNRAKRRVDLMRRVVMQFAPTGLALVATKGVRLLVGGAPRFRVLVPPVTSGQFVGMSANHGSSLSVSAGRRHL